MSFFPHYAPFFLFSAPSKWNVFFRITEIGAHKLRLHAPFTMDIIKGRLLFDAFSDVFMSCICFADTVNICSNKHIFIVISLSLSNHQTHECLHNRSFRRRSKKTSKLLVTGLCEGNSPVTSEFPAQRASNAENVSIWWRHHVWCAIITICPTSLPNSQNE